MCLGLLYGPYTSSPALMPRDPSFTLSAGEAPGSVAASVTWVRRFPKVKDAETHPHWTPTEASQVGTSDCQGLRTLDEDLHGGSVPVLDPFTLGPVGDSRLRYLLRASLQWGPDL